MTRVVPIADTRGARGATTDPRTEAICQAVREEMRTTLLLEGGPQGADLPLPQARRAEEAIVGGHRKARKSEPPDLTA